MLTPTQSSQPSSAPLVSMLVICYNQARFVVETLESVKAQTYKNTELIIADDCSTDDSVAIIERWLNENKIQCTFIHHQKNQGVCKTLNDALDVATGKYISEIAADDLWLPDKIERQVAIMESQPESVGVVYSDAFQIDEHGEPLGMYISAHSASLTRVSPPSVLEALLHNNFIPAMTTLTRRNCYVVVGSYDEGMPTEDWDMWLRIARQYSFFYSPIPSAKYRVRNNSFSHDAITMATGTMKILAKQSDLGLLNEAQSVVLAASLQFYSRAIPRAYFDMATAALRNGDRPATIKHLVNCLKSSKFRLPGRAIDWTALVTYVLFGLRHVRWWKRRGAESKSESNDQTSFT